MMSFAGVNCYLKIWRWSYLTDDSVGGATPTGTFVYSQVRAFLQEQEQEQLLLQQGLETPKVFNANIYPGTLRIQERDEVEISTPPEHPYYGDRFRVINIRYSSHNQRDPRAYILLTLTRSEKAHAAQ